MRLIILGVIGACTILTTCQGEDAVVVKWAGTSATSPKLEFKADGTLIHSFFERPWTWQAIGPDLILKQDGTEYLCGRNTRIKNQLVLTKHNNIGAPNCPLDGLYWDMDPPESLPESYISFRCEPSGQPDSKILKYTAGYLIEADKDSRIACFGRTDTGCDLVTDGNIIADGWIDVSARFGNQAERYEIEERTPDGLRLTQASTSDCSGGMCTYGGYSVVGPCEKVR